MKNKFSILFLTLLISLSFSLSFSPDVEAKRFGSARSFGSKQSYSSPFRRSANQSAPRSASQQKAYQKNQAARQSMSKRGGLMGLLGSLALGGLLGALFFGGAFEGINFMDILMFGGIGFLLYKMFAAKGAARPNPAYSGNQESNYSSEDYGRQSFSTSESNRQSAGFDTDLLFNKDKKVTSQFSDDLQTDADFVEHDIPRDFDQQNFLEGAKSAFKMLQEAWDKRDLAEIRSLTTDKVFAEIQDQLNASTENNQTDVLKIDAELLSIREVGQEMEAVVLFDTIIREQYDEQAEQVREVWHFIKSKNSLQPKWFLDGIQQLEN